MIRSIFWASPWGGGGGRGGEEGGEGERRGEGGEGERRGRVDMILKFMTQWSRDQTYVLIMSHDLLIT